MARRVDGRWVPETDDDFKDWDTDKFMHVTKKIVAAANAEFPNPFDKLNDEARARLSPRARQSALRP